MSRDLIEIYRAANPIQAQQLVAFLAEEGIEAYIENAALLGGAGELPLGWATSPRVTVAEDDLKRAQAFAAEFNRILVEGRQADFDVLRETRLAWSEWPCCPDCGRRRLTSCPACGEADDDFARSEFDEQGLVAKSLRSMEGTAGESEFRPLVECSMCEERFRPKFYQRCAACGHDFGEGADPRWESEPSTVKWYAVLLVVAIVGSLAWAVGVLRQMGRL